MPRDFPPASSRECQSWAQRLPARGRDSAILSIPGRVSDSHVVGGGPGNQLARLSDQDRRPSLGFPICKAGRCENPAHPHGWTPVQAQGPSAGRGVPGRPRALAQPGLAPLGGRLWAQDPGRPHTGQPALQALPSDLSAHDRNEGQEDRTRSFLPGSLWQMSGRSPSPPPGSPPCSTVLRRAPLHHAPPRLWTQLWLLVSLQRHQTSPRRPPRPPRGPARPAGCVPPRGLCPRPPRCPDGRVAPLPRSHLGWHHLPRDLRPCRVLSGLCPSGSQRPPSRERRCNGFQGGQGLGPTHPSATPASGQGAIAVPEPRPEAGTPTSGVGVTEGKSPPAGLGRPAVWAQGHPTGPAALRLGRW